MRKALLLTLLIGALAALPCAHAQDMLETSGIGVHVGGVAQGVGRALSPRVPTQHIGSGHDNSRRSGAPTHRGGHAPQTIVVHPGDYPEPAAAAPEGSATQQKIMVVGERPAEAPPRAAPPKMTELPARRNASAAKPTPPAIFLLKSGERIESGQYILTSHNVQLTSERQPRTIPLSMLDIPGTVSANRERGLELNIPSNSGVVSLGF